MYLIGRQANQKSVASLNKSSDWHLISSQVINAKTPEQLNHLLELPGHEGLKKKKSPDQSSEFLEDLQELQAHVVTGRHVNTWICFLIFK